MINSIASSLGAGSGIDTAALVRDLAAASRGPKVQRFDGLARANQVRISAVAQLRNSLEGFADSLNAVVGEGSTLARAIVSDEKVLAVSVNANASPPTIGSDIIVNQLARSQTSVSAPVADSAAPIGQGGMTLTAGGQAFAITIDATNDSLNGLVSAINASGSGVSASLVNDTGGPRLVLKGQTGAASAFTLTADAGADPGLSQFTTSGGMTQAQSAQDALFSVDGVALSRASNSVADAVPGLTLTLKTVSNGQSVQVTSQRSTTVLKQTVTDFVAAYNSLSTDVRAARTANPGDQGLRRLDSELRGLLGRAVTSDAALNSLSDLGISTNRDGSVTLNDATFDRMLQDRPEAVEALFNPSRTGGRTVTSDPGLAVALDAIRDAAVGSDGGLAILDRQLAARGRAIASDRDRMELREAAYLTRLERQFGNLDARLSSFRATQSYLEQQIKIWSRSDG
jgi:flagellar hook-associated protein 2